MSQRLKRLCPIFEHLLVTRLRHFDAQRRRPGLPPDVAALVSGLSDDRAELTVLNASPTELREVLIQVGGMGEHEFTEVEVDGRPDAFR